MTNYKSQRNKILKNQTRLITALYKGQEWSTPDGHFAVNINLYDGYKTKQDQTILDARPLLDKIILDTKHGIYKQAKTSVNDDQVNVKVNGLVTTINRSYYDFLTALYPTATVYASTDTKSPTYYKPVQLRVKNNIVAVIMPLKV